MHLKVCSIGSHATTIGEGEIMQPRLKAYGNVADSVNKELNKQGIKLGVVNEF